MMARTVGGEKRARAEEGNGPQPDGPVAGPSGTGPGGDGAQTTTTTRKGKAKAKTASKAAAGTGTFSETSHSFFVTFFA